LKCRFDGSCIINVTTRRQCTYCRLKKCFDIKMRKDWIRTEEEIELRQLQKLAKERRKINNLPNSEQPWNRLISIQ
jgi:nuclear receptor subfamily 1 group I